MSQANAVLSIGVEADVARAREQIESLVKWANEQRVKLNVDATGAGGGGNSTLGGTAPLTPSGTPPPASSIPRPAPPPIAGVRDAMVSGMMSASSASAVIGGGGFPISMVGGAGFGNQTIGGGGFGMDMVGSGGQAPPPAGFIGPAAGGRGGYYAAARAPYKKPFGGLGIANAMFVTYLAGQSISNALQSSAAYTLGVENATSYGSMASAAVAANKQAYMTIPILGDMAYAVSQYIRGNPDLAMQLGGGTMDRQIQSQQFAMGTTARISGLRASAAAASGSLVGGAAGALASLRQQQDSELASFRTQAESARMDARVRIQGAALAVREEQPNAYRRFVTDQLNALMGTNYEYSSSLYAAKSRLGEENRAYNQMVAAQTAEEFAIRRAQGAQSFAAFSAFRRETFSRNEASSADVMDAAATRMSLRGFTAGALGFRLSEAVAAAGRQFALSYQELLGSGLSGAAFGEVLNSLRMEQYAATQQAQSAYQSGMIDYRRSILSSLNTGTVGRLLGNNQPFQAQVAGLSGGYNVASQGMVYDSPQEQALRAAYQGQLSAAQRGETNARVGITIDQNTRQMMIDSSQAFMRGQASPFAPQLAGLLGGVQQRYQELINSGRPDLASRELELGRGQVDMMRAQYAGSFSARSFGAASEIDFSGYGVGLIMRDMQGAKDRITDSGVTGIQPSEGQMAQIASEIKRLVQDAVNELKKQNAGDGALN